MSLMAEEDADNKTVAGTSTRGHKDEKRFSRAADS
jgi:hypothetical protein